ncbi:MAG: hypothetical protein Q8Q12_08835 [bacterium]|nr:hypothetical protein [bacterium]
MARGEQIFLHMLTWVDAYRPDAAVVVTYRANEVLEIEQKIRPGEWYDRGFGDGVWLDPAPPRFIREVLKLAARVFKVRVSETVFDSWAKWVEDCDNTPFCRAETARELQESAPSGPFSSRMFLLTEKWRMLFNNLCTRSGPAASLCSHLLQALSFLNLIGEPRPFVLENVYEFVKLIFDGVGKFDFVECVQILHRSQWLTSDSERVWVHDLQIEPSVTGLLEKGGLTPAFHRLSESARKLAVRLPPDKAADMLSSVASVCIQHLQIEQAGKMADSALSAVPMHARGLALRGLARIANGAQEAGISDLHAAINAPTDKRVPAGLLLGACPNNRISLDNRK